MASSSYDEEDDDDDDEDRDGAAVPIIRQLPAVGASTRGSGNDPTGLSGNGRDDPEASSSSSASASGGVLDSRGAAFVTPKFELQYTCNVCETRNRVTVSRLAYREGLVVATCKGCHARHWIADNLDPALSATRNIEEYFRRQGKTGAGVAVAGMSHDDGDGEYDDSNSISHVVSRVSRDVYELERVLEFTGVVMDENGEVVLE